MRFVFTAAAAGSVLLGLSAEASRLTPPVLPLIVRNPYLSAWLGDARASPWNKWPMFWTGEEVCDVFFRDSESGWLHCLTESF